MYKETIIIIIIIILIILGDIITQKYTEKTVSEISIGLYELKDCISQNKEEKYKKIENIEEKWDKKSETLAYYIENDELEKVNTEIAKIKADIETNNEKIAIENLERCIFVLEHIKDKNLIKIVNIF